MKNKLTAAYNSARQSITNYSPSTTHKVVAGAIAGTSAVVLAVIFAPAITAAATMVGAGIASRFVRDES